MTKSQRKLFVDSIKEEVQTKDTCCYCWKHDCGCESGKVTVDQLDFIQITEDELHYV